MSNKIYDEFERSITVKYRAKIWSKFVCAIKEYQLIKPNDHILVCISGGKDSMLMARLFMQLLKHSDFDFKVSYVVMNPGYKDEHINNIKNNLSKLSIDAKIIDSDIFQVNAKQTHPSCFLCAKMRRGVLYNIAQEFNCNKIALGHHYDDVIETTLMNMLNSGSFQTMLPKLKSTSHEGIELIRPMYHVREKDIISWKNYHNLDFIQCACEFVDESEKNRIISQRAFTKKLIKELVKNYNSQVEMNLFKAPSNVTLDMVLGYKDEEEYHSFLEDYNKE